MRTLIIAALVTAPVIAHADPDSGHADALAVHDDAITEDAPHTYVAPGIAFGTGGSHAMGAATIEIGARIADHLVLHVEGLGGATAELFGGQGNYVAGTAGLDATTCATRAKVCAYAGFSAGYAYSKYTESDWFGGDPMSTDSEGAVGMIRAGFDIGSKHLRWRPGIEATVLGPAQASLVNSLAVTF